MIRLVVYTFLFKIIFTAVPLTTFDNRSVIVERVAVVSDIEKQLEYKDAISKASASSIQSSNINLEKGGSYWVFFRILNKSNINGIVLKDSFGDLDKVSQELHIINSENNKAIQSMFSK